MIKEVLAQCPGPDCIKDNIPTLNIVPYFFSNVISFMLFLAGIAAVYFIIISGIKFITSGGDQIKVTDAKKSITFALIGLVVVLLSFVFIKFFSIVTGVDCNVLGITC